MLRLASALARLVGEEPSCPAGPVAPKPASPAPRKPSLKAKPSWRSASLHTDTRNSNFKCPFTATNALTAATQKEIDAYNSKEEIRINTEKINEEETKGDIKENTCRDIVKYNRRSLGFKLEDNKVFSNVASPSSEKSQSHDVSPEDTDKSEGSLPTSPVSDSGKKSAKAMRKSSCTVALDVYRRRGSGQPSARLNSLGLIREGILPGMKEKFGTPEKVMHFFGRCFVKFFSKYQ